MERLTDKIRNFDGTASSPKSLVIEEGMQKGMPSAYCSAIVTKLADYEDAEEQGLLLRLPCKVGDTLWAIRNYKGTVYAQKGFVNEMFFTKEMKLIIAVKNIARGEFGKTVFLTKEEAEQALKQMGE